MLKSRNLDDQTYRQIVESAESRLPWLCPAWTDHNAHDPGITIIELMAWYKEMQQYRLNRFTEALEWRLLKLAGITRRPASAARCIIAVPPDCPARAEGERLQTAEGVIFELEEPIPAKQTELIRVCVRQGERLLDVGELLEGRKMTFQPFVGQSQLMLGFSEPVGHEVRLWFDVEQPENPPRNPFASAEQTPRILSWDCPGGVEIISDETHALSVSGFVTIRFTDSRTPAHDNIRWLTVSLSDAGCEEDVRLSGIAANRFRAAQRETWAKSRMMCAPAETAWKTPLTGALERTGTLAVFIRRHDGWMQTSRWELAIDNGEPVLLMDTSECVEDGENNICLTALDAMRAEQLLFDAKGLPGESFFLDLEGRTLLTDSFMLLCETLERDGTVHPAMRHCTDDLYSCGARDRVFAYDSTRETITFGDGEHGVLLQGGTGAVLAANMILSRCDGGNIPAGTVLCFEKDGMAVCAGAAAGGAERETAEEAKNRLRQYLKCQSRCISASDYEELARRTPGLRVAAVKALPAWDADEPTGVSRTPTVTIVVVPAGSTPRPMPDERFLDAVRRQLDKARPIGTRVLVIPPVYIEISIYAEIYGEMPDEKLSEQHLRDCLSQQVGIGGVVRMGDISAVLQALPGVLRVRHLELRDLSGHCRRDAGGDLYLPRQGVPCLADVRIDRLRGQHTGE